MQLIIIIIIAYIVYLIFKKSNDTVSKSNTTKDTTQREFQKKINEEMNKAYGKLEEFSQDVEKAVKEKRKGNLDLALKYYKQMEDKYLNNNKTKIEGMKPQIASGKGKVLILKDRTIDAQDEFLKVIKWCKERSTEFNKLNKRNKQTCTAAFEHLGYCVGVGQWEDENQYLDAIAGKGNKQDHREVAKRMKVGLDVARQNGIWCNLFSDFKNRVNSKL